MPVNSRSKQQALEEMRSLKHPTDASGGYIVESCTDECFVFLQ